MSDLKRDLNSKEINTEKIFLNNTFLQEINEISTWLVSIGVNFIMNY